MMSASRHSVFNQESGLLALFSLAENFATSGAVANSSTYEAIVAAMAAYPGEETLQARACCTFACLAYSDRNRVAIAEQGGIDAVLAAMQ